MPLVDSFREKYVNKYYTNLQGRNGHCFCFEAKFFFFRSIQQFEYVKPATGLIIYTFVIHCWIQVVGYAVDHSSCAAVKKFDVMKAVFASSEFEEKS